MDPLIHDNYDFIRWEKEDGSWKIDRLLGGPREAPVRRLTHTLRVRSHFEMTEKTAAQIEAEVGQVMQGLYDAIKRADLGPWMSTLNDPSGQWLLGMDVVNLREASEELVAAWTSEGESQLERQEIDDLEIRVVAISSTSAHALCTSPDRRWYFVNGKVDRAITAEHGCLS